MADELKDTFNVKAELIRSAGGVFEIEADGELIFSKAKLGRFPDDGEVQALLKKKTG